MDIDFESYIRGSEPGKKKKASAWKTAIGLQAVDGLPNLRLSERYSGQAY